MHFFGHAARPCRVPRLGVIPCSEFPSTNMYLELPTLSPAGGGHGGGVQFLGEIQYVFCNNMHEQPPHTFQVDATRLERNRSSDIYYAGGLNPEGG